MTLKNEGRLIAKARDKFFQKNPDLFETASLYRGEAKPYLKNRLEKAFIAGWDGCRLRNLSVIRVRGHPAGYVQK